MARKTLYFVAADAKPYDVPKPPRSTDSDIKRGKVHARRRFNDGFKAHAVNFSEERKRYMEIFTPRKIPADAHFFERRDVFGNDVLFRLRKPDGKKQSHGVRSDLDKLIFP
jgi:hypothetical protein